MTRQLATSADVGDALQPGGGDLVTGALVVVLVLGMVAWYLASCAARLDRLHHRVEAAAAAMENQLLRRASASATLAASGLLDPASALLVAGAAADAVAAGEARATEEAEEPGAGGLSWQDVDAREAAESDLTQALRATLTPDVVEQVAADPLGRDLLADLEAASQRASLARRFHNDAVSQAQRVRSKRLVRWARLAGRAPPPRTFEMDDETLVTLRR